MKLSGEASAQTAAEAVGGMLRAPRARRRQRSRLEECPVHLESAEEAAETRGNSVEAWGLLAEQWRRGRPEAYGTPIGDWGGSTTNECQASSLDLSQNIHNGNNATANTTTTNPGAAGNAIRGTFQY